MKKILLGGLACLSFLFISTVSTYASDDLLINSTSISNDVETFGKENYTNMLEAFLLSEVEGKSVSDFKLGSPFTVVENSNGEYENFYFPILDSADTITYVYTVTLVNGSEYIGSISEFMAHDLERVKENDSDSPITIYASNQDIYMEQDDEVEVLSELNISDSDEFLEIAETSDELSPVEVTEELETVQIGPKTRTVLSGADYTSLAWKTREVQGREKWCSAVTLTNILANKNIPILTRASAIIDFTHPKLTTAQKKEAGLTDVAVANYANSKGCNAKVKNGTLTTSQVRTQIKNGSAVYMHMAGTQNGKSSRHAMAITGWAIQPNKKEYYWVSNPWHNYVTMTQANTNPVVVTIPTGYYYWVSTVYGF